MFDSLLKFNDFLQHAPVGVVAMLFSISLGYVLKASAFFPNNRIPIVVIPVTALLYAIIQFCADRIDATPNAGYYAVFNFVLGFVYGAFAWLVHAQILRRFLDPKMFNSDGTTRFFKNDKHS